MNFDLSEEHLAVREAARDFAQNVLKPGVIERDNEQRFPEAEIKQLAELGFMGMMVDPKYGGSGMDTLSYVLAMEEISKVDASTSVCMSVNNSLVCWGLEKFGTEEQKEKYLVPLAKGEKIGAFCLSEPEAAAGCPFRVPHPVPLPRLPRGRWCPPQKIWHFGLLCATPTGVVPEEDFAAGAQVGPLPGAADLVPIAAGNLPNRVCSAPTLCFSPGLPSGGMRSAELEGRRRRRRRTDGGGRRRPEE
ncbi:MAG: acyl-CoA dehydrogenase family protein, partial [bacterium]|nr:acyl-CoA dehydrogenase family protein [bacterium]